MSAAGAAEPPAGAASNAAAPAGKKDHNKYRKPKDWDVEGTEHWKIEVRGSVWLAVLLRRGAAGNEEGRHR